MDTRNLDGILLHWPAVCVVIGGRKYVAQTDHFEDDDLSMEIRLEKQGGSGANILRSAKQPPATA